MKNVKLNTSAVEMGNRASINNLVRLSLIIWVGRDFWQMSKSTPRFYGTITQIVYRQRSFEPCIPVIIYFFHVLVSYFPTCVISQQKQKLQRTLLKQLFTKQCLQPD